LESSLIESERDRADRLTVIHALENGQRQLTAVIDQLNAALDGIRGSLLWRATHPEWLQRIRASSQR
jgi:hypothetical protein